MGKNGGKKTEPNSNPGRSNMTLREESSGKKQPNNLNAKTMCKLDHIKNIAHWAATDVSITSLAAFYGQRLAATTEALGLRNDPSFFLCERCESILQPGHNCTVRIEKNKSRMRHRSKKSYITTQNNVVYTCHFCSHRNSMRGTPKGYVKEICPSKAKPPSKSKFGKTAAEEFTKLHKVTSNTEEPKMDNVTLPVAESLETRPPETPMPASGLSLLDAKRRKRNRSSAKKVAEPESSSMAANAEENTNASSKRRKKSWTSLKEIAQGNAHDTSKKFPDLTLPFII